MFDVSLYFSRNSVNFQWNMHVWCLKLDLDPCFLDLYDIFLMWSGQVKSQSQPLQCVCAKKFEYLLLSRSSAGYQHVPTKVGSCRKKDPSNLSRKMWSSDGGGSQFLFIRCFSSYLMLIHLRCQFSSFIFNASSHLAHGKRKERATSP